MRDYLRHYGTPQIEGIAGGSGRYRKGTGDSIEASKTFMGMYKELKAQNLSELEIAKAMNCKSTDELRTRRSIATNEVKKYNRIQILKMRERGMSWQAIADELELPNESSARSLVAEDHQKSQNKTREIADILKAEVENKEYLDVGSAVEIQLGVADTKLKAAVAMLEEEGYKKTSIFVDQATNPGKQTRIEVLTKDDKTITDIYKNRDKISSIDDKYVDDGVVKTIKPPVSIDSSRIKVVYAEDGGSERDGEIRLRPGVDDISLGNNMYVQTRIAVDGTHYLKGMAVYGQASEFPDGVDILFNTKKERGTPMLGEKDNSVLKSLKNDPDNPFGATVRQRTYVGADGKEHQSAINIVNDDSDWSTWSRSISSQLGSKQYPDLVKKQIAVSLDAKRAELTEIMNLTNPVVKRNRLKEFASDCDSAAVDLKIAALPRQATHVILPINSLKEHEIYAPDYNDGEEVVLIRYPHGGTFEIPRLTVNNKNAEGRQTIGNKSHTAVGINYKTAGVLSGADFDGDTVVVIPTKGQHIKTTSPLEGLKGFDTDIYKNSSGAPSTSPKTGFNKQLQMGNVSNLITDMTIKGATTSELTRAVRHSMVVIDAEKHNLDWRKSAQDNQIAQLKEKYQGGKDRGASTLISKASSQANIPERRPAKGYKRIGDQAVDAETGKVMWEETGGTHYKKQQIFKVTDESTGKVKYQTKGKAGTVKDVDSASVPDSVKKKLDDGKRGYIEVGKPQKNLIKSTKMAETDDAYTLSSGTKMEGYYAEYANTLKGMANQARKSYLSTATGTKDPAAAKKYAAEVKSLEDKLKVAESHAPQERKAQLVTSKKMEMYRRDNPDVDRNSDEYKRKANQVLAESRARLGDAEHKTKVDITDKEWEAIQNNAVSPTKLERILNNADAEQVRKLATPKETKAMSTAKLNRAKSLLNAGYTLSEVAKAVDMSVSSLSGQLKEGE